MYCIDTSALIAAWDERYPIDHFPAFWKAMDGIIAAGRLVAPVPVLKETEKKSDELHAWLKERDGMFVELNDAIQLRVRAILAKYERLVMAMKHRTAADSFVIALALERKLTIVSEERPTGNLNRPKIPDVVADQDFACPHIYLLDLIKREKWVIG